MRKFLGGLVIFVMFLFAVDRTPAAAQVDDDPSRALALLERDVAAAGDALTDLEDWSVQHIEVSGLAEALRMIEDRSDRLPNDVVLAAGTNESADLDAFETEVESIVEALEGVERIIWLDFPELRERDVAANRILREIARADAAVRVLSWNGAQRSITAYESAGEGLTPDGATAMSSLIASELRGRSVGLAAGPLFQPAPTEPPTATTTTVQPTTTTTPPSTTSSTTTAPPDAESEAETETESDQTTTSTTSTTSTSTAPSTIDAEQSEEATESALSALQNAEARAASLAERDFDQETTAPPVDDTRPETVDPSPVDEQAQAIVEGQSDGRGLRQLGAFLFTFVGAGFFVAIKRNEFEPYDGRRRREPGAPQ